MKLFHLTNTTVQTPPVKFDWHRTSFLLFHGISTVRYVIFRGKGRWRSFAVTAQVVHLGIAPPLAGLMCGYLHLLHGVSACQLVSNPKPHTLVPES